MECRKFRQSITSAIDWQLILAVLMAFSIVGPRSVLIAQSHSETWDAYYHITRGLAYLTRTLAEKDLSLNDPPLGEGLIALPVLVLNLSEGRAADDDRLYDHAGRAEKIAVWIAIWNSILFLILVSTAFVWLRRLYNAKAAWLAAGILTVEPNFAAHIPVPALDVIGTTGIVLACYCIWLFFESPSLWRLIWLVIASATAMMIKHTAVIIPGVIAVSAGLCWVVKSLLQREPLAQWKTKLMGRILALGCILVMTGVTVWILTVFEMCPPVSPVDKLAVDPQFSELTSPWPAGSYVRSFLQGMKHSRGGHHCYLFGERRLTGWWYYFPAVATYKVPIGIGLILALGLISVWRSPLRWNEWGLLVPLVTWTLFLMTAKINIGFRSFLPAYLFMMLASTRCLCHSGKSMLITCWIAAAAAGLHALSVHPDYMCYLNFPRQKAYLDISDSNVDWSQSLKQLRDYVDTHPENGRTYWFRGFGMDDCGTYFLGSGEYYLHGHNVVILSKYDPRPTTGLLVISPVHVVGAYDIERDESYAALIHRSPDAVIGHSLLVYDLDRISEPKDVVDRFENWWHNDHVVFNLNWKPPDEENPSYRCDRWGTFSVRNSSGGTADLKLSLESSHWPVRIDARVGCAAPVSVTVNQGGSQNVIFHGLPMPPGLNTLLIEVTDLTKPKDPTRRPRITIESGHLQIGGQRLKIQDPSTTPRAVD